VNGNARIFGYLLFEEYIQRSSLGLNRKGKGNWSMITRKNMKTYLTLLTLLTVGSFLGCSQEAAKSPDVADGVRKALDQSDLKDVSVSQDRDKGVVTLSGNVSSDSDKAQAESIAKSMAGGQVVADQIAVLPPGGESDAKSMHSDLDKGIEKNLDAALIQNKFDKDVKYKVKSGVVTLTGDVNSESKRARVQKVASTVPNVQQVVNELQIKNQKASSMH
jgi:hyperosmotically inducible protein